MKMFDINNDEMRNRKLKIIEILLIVGGIIGAIISGDVYLMNTIFGLIFGLIFSVFILVSIIYYGLISHKIFHPIFIRVLGVIIAFCFTIIAVWPFMQAGIAIFASGAYIIPFILSLIGLILLTTCFAFLLICIDEDKRK